MPPLKVALPKKLISRIEAMSDELGHDGLSQTILYVITDWFRQTEQKVPISTDSVPNQTQIGTDSAQFGTSNNSIVFNNNLNNTILSEEGECEGGELSLVPIGTDSVPIRPKSVPKSTDPTLIELALQIRAKLEVASEANYIPRLPAFNAEKSARILDQVIRLDKIPREHMLDLWSWIIADPFWAKNMLSIQNCRKDNGNGAKIIQCWTKWRRSLHEPADVACYQRNGTPDPIEEEIIFAQ